jgi:hypothetical protein
MKAAVIGFCLLVFSAMMAGVTHSDLFVTSTYYEGTYADAYGNLLPANVSSISETQQYSQSMNIVSVIFSTLSWGWIYEFVPTELHAAITWFVVALAAFSYFFIAVAFVELYRKEDII